ncbi:MAG: hypothetical protein HRF49_08210 [bacterium]|jgi:hypothetical protein
MKRKLSILFAVIIAAQFFCSAFAADYPPGIKYSTFLKAFNYNSENGSLMLNSFDAVFLPDDVFTSSGTQKLWAIVRNSSGGDLYRLDFYVFRGNPPYSNVSHYNLSALGPLPANGMTMDFFRSGDYVMDFYTSAGKFFSFPFSIDATPSSDPFTPGLYRINGDWADWAYFRYADADPANNLFFTVWLRNSSGPGYKLVKQKIKIFNKNGGAYVFSAQDRSVNLSPGWTHYDFTIATTAEPRPYAIVANDLLKTDGDYVLKIFLDDQLYGEWEFSVQGGKFAPAGRTIRGTADPLTFIEGGRDEFWYAKSK